jgi:hypothetical protein
LQQLLGWSQGRLASFQPNIISIIYSSQGGVKWVLDVLVSKVCTTRMDHALDCFGKSSRSWFVAP